MDVVIFHPDGVTYYDRTNRIANLKVIGGHYINGTAYLPHIWQLGDKIPEFADLQTDF